MVTFLPILRTSYSNPLAEFFLFLQVQVACDLLGSLYGGWDGAEHVRLTRRKAVQHSGESRLSPRERLGVGWIRGKELNLKIIFIEESQLTSVSFLLPLQRCQVEDAGHMVVTH